jgi:hypothetical protein
VVGVPALLPGPETSPPLSCPTNVVDGSARMSSEHQVCSAVAMFCSYVPRRCFVLLKSLTVTDWWCQPQFCQSVHIHTAKLAPACLLCTLIGDLTGLASGGRNVNAGALLGCPGWVDHILRSCIVFVAVTHSMPVRLHLFMCMGNSIWSRKGTIMLSDRWQYMCFHRHDKALCCCCLLCCCKVT